MQKQLRIFLAGVMLLTPLAVTVWLIWALGSWLEQTGRNLFPFEVPTGVGAAVVIVGVYLVGLLTHFWVFRSLFSWVDSVVTRVPGVKTIYESVRDLLKLFGSGSARMGRVVQYKVPGSDVSALAVLTNDHPDGAEAPDEPARKVAIYVPFSYMFGGVTVFVSPENIREIDMPVERALKLCATAQVTSTEEEEPKRKKRPARKDPDKS